MIGGGWSWPHKDEWPNVIAVMVDLNELGYSVGSFQMPGWDVGQKAARDGVRAFQRDYNDLVAYLKKWAVPQQGFADPPRSKLGVDGWIGPNTWAAMRWAFRRADAGITPTFRKGAQTAREAGAT